VIESDGRPLVFVKTSAESFAAREVRIGLQNPGQAEILAGLRDGELIAVSGAVELRAAWRAAR